MNPEPQPPLPNQSDPYQFIMHPEKPTHRSFLPHIGGDSFLAKILFIVGGAVVLMIVGVIVVNVFFNNSSNINGSVSVVQSATEIARLAEEGEKATDQGVKNAAANTAVTMESQKQAWLSFLADRDRTMDSKEQALGQDAATDQELEQAAQSNTFDETYSDIMRQELTAYGQQLQDTYNASDNAAQREALSQDYDDVQLLLTQWGS